MGRKGRSWEVRAEALPMLCPICNRKGLKNKSFNDVKVHNMGYKWQECRFCSSKLNEQSRKLGMTPPDTFK
jgi:hypothetical protein